MNYAFKVARAIFTHDELSNGIFVDPIRKTQSKKTPLVDHRTEVLKEALVAKFGYHKDDAEGVWQFVRVDVNKKIGQLGRIRKR